MGLSCLFIKGLTMEKYKYYVNGQFCDIGVEIPVVNPFDGTQIASIIETPPEMLKSTLQTARKAVDIWKKRSFKERSVILKEIEKIILDNLCELGHLETEEIGKAFKECLFVDISLGAQCFEYYASFLETLCEESISNRNGIDLLQYDPFGVVGVFLPYNVPIMSFGFTCAAALAAGNALIIKPSEFASLSILKLIDLIKSLDIPKGLINVVTGKGETIGAALAESEIDMISFTGNRETLKKVVRNSAVNPKKIVAELGGANISVLMDDASLVDAVENVIASAYMKQGQVCLGTSIALAHESIYKKVKEMLIVKTKKITLGDPNNPSTGIGPMTTKEHLDSTLLKIDKLKSIGGKVLCGGKVSENFPTILRPTLIEMEKIHYEEMFSPVLILNSYKNDEELRQILKSNPTAFAMQIWSENINKAKMLADDIPCGTIWINSFVQMDMNTPTGGCKQSGWGRQLGKYGFFEFVQIKHIGLNFKDTPVVGWFGV